MFRVLTIFDNPSHKKGLITVLQKIGCKVIDCQRKYASFLRTMQYVPHLLVFESSTLSSEDMKLLQLIKRNKEAAHTPVLFIGPLKSPEIEKKLKSFQLAEYFSAPIDVKRFAISVKKIEKKTQDETKEKLGIDKNQLSRQEEKLILNRNEPLSRKLAIIEKHVQKLLAFPTTVVQLIKKSEDGCSSAADLGRIIESDSAVAAEVLKLSNSVYFATAGHRTTSLRDAIVRIGMEQTKSIVVSMTVMKSIRDENYQTGFNHRDYWTHSLAVAIISSMIAKHSGRAHPDEAFVFGLLHELGVFLYNEYLNRFFLMLLDKSTEMGFPFSFFQQELMGMSHNDLMMQLCESWNFPTSFAENFSALDEFKYTSGTIENAPFANITTIADTVAHMLRLGKGADCCVRAISLEEIGSLKLHTFLQEQTYEEIFQTFNLYNMVLNLGKQEYINCIPRMIDNKNITILLLESDRHWSPLKLYLEREQYSCITVESEAALFDELERDEYAIFIIAHYEEKLRSVLEHCKLYSYRGIVFDEAEMVSESYNSYGIIVTNYPVDLRNIDMVIHAIHLNFFEQNMTGRIGTLLPIGENHITAPRIMVVHPERSIQSQIETELQHIGVGAVEAILDGDKAINIAKTSTKDFDYIFVGHESRVIATIDIVLEIKKQTRHKRAKFVLLYQGEKPPFITLEQYAQAGVIRLLDLTDSELSNTLRRILGRSTLTTA